jgi:hypothetical protein
MTGLEPVCTVQNQVCTMQVVTMTKIDRVCTVQVVICTVVVKRLTVQAEAMLMKVGVG